MPFRVIVRNRADWNEATAAVVETFVGEAEQFVVKPGATGPTMLRSQTFVAPTLQGVLDEATAWIQAQQGLIPPRLYVWNGSALVQPQQ